MNIDYSAKINMPDYFESKLRSRHHYEFIKKNVGFSDIKNILEIGPGDGALIHYIRKRHKNLDITVIEPGSVLCKHLRKIENIRIINDYIENIESNTKFDLVIMSHVLEHLEDPIRTLNHIFSKFMRDGSFLYIDVPNIDYELRSTLAAKVTPPIHLFFFDAFGLIRILLHLGFSENNIVVRKYSTLPLGFIRRMESIGGLRNSKNMKLQLLWYKALNRLSLFCLNVFRMIFLQRPSEVGFDTADYKYNNIAIIALR